MTSETDAINPEAIADEEPRYLRRQKPVEVRRKKFGKRTWPFYRRAMIAGVAVLVGGFALYQVGSFFLYSPRVTLASLDQIEISGTHYLARQAITEKFAQDENRSVLRVPLDDRRAALESIPWVDHAIVSRILPDRLRVEIVERSPVAFLRNGTDLGLIDGHGVLLDRPVEGDFQFPVVSGISEATPASQREQRMAYYTQLLRDLTAVRPGAADHVSEVDLSDASDVRVTLAGLSEMGITGLEDQGPVLVHFGTKDFDTKFRVLVDNISQWRASAGRVDSIDLRFSKQVVVNPESRAVAVKTPVAAMNTQTLSHSPSTKPASAKKSH
ncbi:MAG TPA: FtsQ-type POTRA domain-containing protein [Candidatus Acidoferrales bacterium]